MRFALALILLTLLGLGIVVLGLWIIATAGQPVDDGADEGAEGDWPHVPRGLVRAHRGEGE